MKGMRPLCLALAVLLSVLSCRTVYAAETVTEQPEVLRIFCLFRIS